MTVGVVIIPLLTSSLPPSWQGGGGGGESWKFCSLLTFCCVCVQDPVFGSVSEASYLPGRTPKVPVIRKKSLSELHVCEGG